MAISISDLIAKKEQVEAGKKAFDSAWKELKDFGYLKVHFMPDNGKEESEYSGWEKLCNNLPIGYALIVCHGYNVCHTEHRQDDSC